jgi:hypothetical protein
MDEEESFKNADDQICQIINITREAYLQEARPYANEHA